MSTETLEAQAVGGPEVVGSRLAAARAAKGWSVESAAAALKVPAHVVDSLEHGQWQRLGAPVFVRGQLRSYARQLGIEPNSLLGNAEVEQWVPVTLVSHVRPQRLRRWTDGLGRGLVYLIGGMSVLALLVLLLRLQWGGEKAVASLDEFQVPAPVVDDIDAGQALPVMLPPADPAVEPGVAQTAPVAGATSAGNAAASQVGGAGQLQLQFADQSWIEIHARNGSVIERAMVSAGQTRSYPVSDLGRVLLGNSAQVTAQLDGRSLDLAPLRRSNVARFTVSSDGSASPVAH